MSRSSYIASAENARTPLSMAEVELLLREGAKALLRDERRLQHLLERLPVTLRNHRDAVTGLTRQLESARRTQRAGRSSTLSPRDAVRFLSPEDLDSLLSERLAVRTATLEDTIAALRHELALLRSQQP